MLRSSPLGHAAWEWNYGEALSHQFEVLPTPEHGRWPPSCSRRPYK